MTQILLIEDEEPIRRVMVRILTEESSSYEITEAIDGKEGLSKLSKSSFDLVLCDIKMPKMDGIEVLQKTRDKEIFVPFIMLTGHGNVETAVEAMKLGAYDFIAVCEGNFEQMAAAKMVAVSSGTVNNFTILESADLNKIASTANKMVSGFKPAGK